MDNFTPTPALAPMPAKPRSSFWLVLTAVIIVLLLAGGAASYAYYINPAILNKLPAPIRALLVKAPSPNEVQSGMMSALSKVKAASYELDLTSPPDWAGQQNVGGNLEIVGSFDSLTPENLKSQNRLRLQAALSPDSDSIDVELENLIIGKNFYLKINQPELPTALADFDLSWLTNRWIKAESKELQDQAGQFSSTADLQDWQQIKQILETNNPIGLGTLIDEEEIDGKPTYHYPVVFDKQKMDTMFDELEKFARSSGNLKTETDVARLQYQIAQFKQAFASLQQPRIEIWIDQTSYLPLKLMAWFKPSNRQPNELALTLRIADYNQPLALTAPTETTPLEEIMKQFFEKILGPMMFGQMFNGQSQTIPFGSFNTTN